MLGELVAISPEQCRREEGVMTWLGTPNGPRRVCRTRDDDGAWIYRDIETGTVLSRVPVGGIGGFGLAIAALLVAMVLWRRR